MSLIPEKPRAPKRISPKITVLYGAPKVGKSTAVAGLPNHLHLDMEGGCDFLSGTIVDFPQIVKNMNKDRDVEALGSINKMDVLRLVYQEAQATPDKYQYVSFDTVDELEKMCQEDVTRQFGVDFSELGYGQGYNLVRSNMINTLDYFVDLGMSVLVIGHRKRSIVGEGNAEVKISELDLQGKNKNVVMSHADAIAYVGRSEEGVLQLSFKAGVNEGVEAGSRTPHLVGKKILLNQPSDWTQVYPELSTK